MLAVADWREELCWNPTLKPERSPLLMYLANALSVWVASALDHASTLSGVVICDRISGMWREGGLWSSRQMRSAVY